MGGGGGMRVHVCCVTGRRHVVGLSNGKGPIPIPAKRAQHDRQTKARSARRAVYNCQQGCQSSRRSHTWASATAVKARTRPSETRAARAHGWRETQAYGRRYNEKEFQKWTLLEVLRYACLGHVRRALFSPLLRLILHVIKSCLGWRDKPGRQSFGDLQCHKLAARRPTTKLGTYVTSVAVRSHSKSTRSRPKSTRFRPKSTRSRPNSHPQSNSNWTNWTSDLTSSCWCYMCMK